MAFFREGIHWIHIQLSFTSDTSNRVHNMFPGIVLCVHFLILLTVVDSLILDNGFLGSIDQSVKRYTSIQLVFTLSFSVSYDT